MQATRRDGFIWGVGATLAMTALMVIGVATGMSPMPKPVPVALMGQILGEGAGRPVLMITGITAHLLYGGMWGAIAVMVVDRLDVVKGLALGAGLWLLMQILVLPYLGWGMFGMDVTPAIAVVTLVLHLVYGGTLGYLAQRAEAPAPA